MKRKLAIVLALMALAGTAPLLTACYTTQAQARTCRQRVTVWNTRRNGTPATSARNHLNAFDRAGSPLSRG